MQDCIDHTSCGIENLDMIKARIEGVRSESIHLFPKKLLNHRTEEIRCYDMAVDQALSIVYSLEARFITGSGDEAPRCYRGKGLVYEDESIFR